MKGIKRIIDAMLTLEPGAMSQEPVWLPDIRELAGLPHDLFNETMLELTSIGVIFMDKHAHPGAVTEEERSEFLVDASGDVFVVAVFRKGAARKIEALSLANRSSAIETRGGTRPGSGRKAGKKIVPDKFRRVHLSGVRLPKWLIVWLKHQGRAGSLIEQALIERYKLTPPA